MKFFWKIFISILLITVTFFWIGSYYLIETGFEYSINKEINSTYEENSELHKAAFSLMQRSGRSDFALPLEFKVEDWEIRNLGPDFPKKTIPFKFSDSEFNSLFENNWLDIESDLLKKVNEEGMAYEVINIDGNYFIHTGSAIKIMDSEFYIENYSDVTLLYANKERQYQISVWLIVAMIIVTAIVAGIVSKFLTKPIKVLADTTREFAEGNLSKRSAIYHNDEIGLLSKEFNNMAEKLEFTVQELKDAAERQETFVGNFVHELKTPLTSIMGYSDMVRSRKMSNENIVLSANYIFEESKRLESLSMKLMDLIVIKKQEFEMVNMPTHTLFNSVEAAISPVFEKENINLKVEYDDENIMVEPDLIKTVFVNLLDNARKAIVKNGEILMKGIKYEDYYEIKIADNGRGIENEELSKITEAFYMVDKSRARKQGGAGLGLSICSKIIEVHNWEMIFESQINKGTVVTIKIPLKYATLMQV